MSLKYRLLRDEQLVPAPYELGRTNCHGPSYGTTGTNLNQSWNSNSNIHSVSVSTEQGCRPISCAGNALSTSESSLYRRRVLQRTHAARENPTELERAGEEGGAGASTSSTRVSEGAGAGLQRPQGRLHGLLRRLAERRRVGSTGVTASHTDSASAGSHSPRHTTRSRRTVMPPEDKEKLAAAGVANAYAEPERLKAKGVELHTLHTNTASASPSPRRSNSGPAAVMAGPVTSGIPTRLLGWTSPAEQSYQGRVAVVDIVEEENCAAVGRSSWLKEPNSA